MSVNIQTSDGLVKIAGTPTIDTSFSNISKNPVQNNVITQKFEQIDSQIRTQNSNLEDYGLNNVFDGNWTQGYLLTINGNIITDSKFITTTNYYNIESGDYVKIDYPSSVTIRIVYYDSNKGFIEYTDYIDVSHIELKSIPSGAKYLRLHIYNDGNEIHPQSAERLTIYINNAIDELKNDLSNKSPKILFKTIWANDKITGVPTPQSNYLLDDSIDWWSDVNIIGITVVDCLSIMHGDTQIL